jgi:hypothetical protein
MPLAAVHEPNGRTAKASYNILLPRTRLQGRIMGYLDKPQ